MEGTPERPAPAVLASPSDAHVTRDSDWSRSRKSKKFEAAVWKMKWKVLHWGVMITVAGTDRAE
jgi:hypothetical protein